MPPAARTAVAEHYESVPLRPRVEAALDAAGLDRGPVPWTALAPLDEFHLGGLRASRELAVALDPPEGSQVLDLGSGLGGPARLLAADYGATVTGIDLSGAFVEVATLLSQRTGLQAGTHFRQGDVIALPFPDAHFDHAWTQHVAMNVADRAALYGEARRVIAAGGRLAIYDVVARSGDPLTFPVPWAASPATSHLLTAAETRAAVVAAGFTVVSNEDLTETALGWLADQQREAAAAPTPGAGLSLAVVMGEDFAGMASNLAENLTSGRAGVLRLVAQATD